MSKLIILVMCMPFFAACTNESEKNHDLMIKKYLKAAVNNGSAMQIRSINTQSKKHTVYTSYIEFQFTSQTGQKVKSSVTIETVGTNQMYIVVNGDCINTNQLAYELESCAEDTRPAGPVNSTKTRRDMESKYMRYTPEYILFR